MKRRFNNITRLILKKVFYATGLRVGATRMLVFNADKVLLVRHRGSQVWNLPGGGFSRWEDPATAAQRELMEELQLRVTIQKKLGVYNNTSAPRMDDWVHIFVAHSSQNIGKLSWEISEVGWFLPQKIPHNTTQGTRRRLAEALNQSPVSTDW